MVRKVFRSGNSLVVALPTELLQSLALDEGAEVDVALHDDGKQIVIAPKHANAEDVDEQFAQQVAEFIQAYRPALEALAK